VPGATVVRGTVVTPREIIREGQVVVEDGKIVDVGPWNGGFPGRVLDFRDCLVASGFIDLHVHGGGGSDVMDASPQGLDRLSDFLAAGGVTSFLATTYSAPQNDILAVAGTIRNAARKGTEGAIVLGLHLEGPYINPERRGAQSAAHIRSPSLEELDEVHGAADGVLRIVTMAPELDGALEAAAWLRSKGVIPSAGHTDATYDEMMAGVEAGFSHVAHLFNGMRPFHHREPGTVGAALDDDRVTVELIADGIHLHPAALRLAAGRKGAGKTALVSDAVAPAGLPDGEHMLGEERVRVEKGRCLLGSGALAGSTIRLSDAVRNMVELARSPFAEAIEMASTTPAGILGLAERKGRLVPGMDADLTVLDKGFSIRLTMVGGRIVYGGGVSRWPARA